MRIYGACDPEPEGVTRLREIAPLPGVKLTDLIKVGEGKWAWTTKGGLSGLGETMPWWVAVQAADSPLKPIPTNFFIV